MRSSHRAVLACLALLTARCSSGHKHASHVDAGDLQDAAAPASDAAMAKDASGDEDAGLASDAAITTPMNDAAEMTTPIGGGPQDAGQDADILDAGPASDIQPSDAPKELAKGLCRAYAACLSPVLELAYFNGQDCDDFMTRQQTDRELRFLLASISERRITFRPTLLATCQSDLEKQACSVQSSRLPASCVEAIEGKVSIGGACNLNYDCKGNAFCDKGATGTTCPGTCRAALGAGKACLTDFACVDGLSCDAGKCAAPLAEGASCSVESDCPIGLTCQGQASARSCRSLDSVYTGQADDACDPSAGTLCQSDLVCETEDAMNSLCKQPGAQSGCLVATPSECPSGQYCKDADDSKTTPPSPGVAGVCADLPIDQQSCNDSALCAPGAICSSSDQLCHAYVIAGQACADAVECYSGQCDAGICVTPHDCTTM